MTTSPPLTANPTNNDLPQSIARQIGYPFRAPLLKDPGDYGLEFRSLTFPSLDGVPLEAWYIPCQGSNKIIIANQPLWFNRYGLPAHLEPWKSIGGPLNSFEVDYVADYRILHENGYNVLTYDMRNLGQSGSANGGVGSGGRYEARDVIGSIHYVRSQPEFENMAIGLFSRCQGGNASIYAMAEAPEVFKGIRCMVAPQPLSVGVAIQQLASHLGISDQVDDIERELTMINSFTFAEMTPVPFAKAVTVPTFLYQVRNDAMTRPEDVQAMYDNIPIADKKLFWIEDTLSRWDGYLYFQRHPEMILEWFRRFM